MEADARVQVVAHVERVGGVGPLGGRGRGAVVVRPEQVHVGKTDVAYVPLEKRV